MPVTTRDGDTVRSEAHSLLVSESVPAQRVGSSAWVGRQLADGAKVFYTARPSDWDAGDARWLTGPSGSPGAARAVATGQLEIRDFLDVIGLAGGTTDGLRRLQHEEVDRGLDEGWPRVAMSQESASRPMADDDEIAEYLAQEDGYDLLGHRRPLTTLCQLTTPYENPTSVWETTALHHGRIVDDRWSTGWSDGRWQVRGDVDVHVVQRFGAALHGALRRRLREETDPDLHVDASGIDFFDVSSAQSLMLAAHASARRQLIVMHGASASLRQVVRAVGQPRTLVFADDGVGR